MDNAFSRLLRTHGLGRLEPVDSEVDRLYQQYAKDRMAVPTDIRQIFDFIANASLPTPKDDEAFRFFLDED